MIEIKDLQVTIGDKKIIDDMNLKIGSGETHALMGPNGSGKSTLANAIMGHPKYKVEGQILIDGEDVVMMKPDERARKGLFLSFQHPVEIPGVTVEGFLRMAYNSTHKTDLDVLEFHKMMMEKMEQLHIDQSFSRRYLNEGFSGGEKKRMEVLQMTILEPRFIILDETDSGLDIDALKIVSDGVNRMRDGKRSILLITYFIRRLKQIEPDTVHVMRDGKIIKIGDKNLAHEIEQKGYKDM